ncbi:uncharacterized protein LOC132754583 [Ruditapes philippinarum]|uniref:uncharacterized protein LOC132754583 n=1 Tax=Ruditapes philippinarum TaxID=129788 RepID=UPI00295BA32A|nr:uncharacterized protein LOC132754583 [Ruditapes philippinarum]
MKIFLYLQHAIPFMFILGIAFLSTYLNTKTILPYDTEILKTGITNLTSYIRNHGLKIPHNQWTVMITVNNGFYDFFQNWHFYFQKLGINAPVIAIAEDKYVYDKLILNYSGAINIVHSHLPSIDKAVKYNSEPYNSLISRRSLYISDLLNIGLNIINTDADTVWLQNPLQHLEGDYDIWIQSDGKNNVCPGFMAVQNSAKSRKLILAWKQILERQDKKEVDQVVLNRLLIQKFSNLSVKILDPDMFASGKRFFQDQNYKQRQHVVVVHNNFIIGHDNKLARFKNFNLWSN